VIVGNRIRLESGVKMFSSGEVRGEAVGELLECDAQLGVALGAEEFGDLLIGGLGVVSDGLLETFALRGESDDTGTSVGGVGLAGDVASVFEVAEEVVDGLLGDLELIGKLGRALSIEGGVAEHPDVRRSHIVVPRGGDSGNDLLPDPLPPVPHACAEEGPAVRGFA
jgi:hypothetical protein